MCRIAAYAGRPVTLSTVLYDPPRSLEELSIDPREQQSGRLNVDGTGVAWFAPEGVPDADGGVVEDPRPLRYRTDLPAWADPNLPDLARRLRGGVILAAARSTTPGLPQGAAFVHPFTSGGLAGTHNGWISDFRARVARPLMAELTDEAFSELTGMSDTNVLFLLAADAHREGASLLDAARTAIARTTSICDRLGASATLTLVLADRTGLAAVNAAVGRPANSLYLGGDVGAGFLASEAMDPAIAWHPVGEGAAATLTPNSMEITA